MKLSKRQREQVVELLLCAADVALATARPVSLARHMLGHGDDVFYLAIAARRAVAWMVPREDDVYQAQLLEAAARVEEGSWP